MPDKLIPENIFTTNMTKSANKGRFGIGEAAPIAKQTAPTPAPTPAPASAPASAPSPTSDRKSKITADPPAPLDSKTSPEKPVTSVPSSEVKKTVPRSLGSAEVIRMQQKILEFKEAASSIPFFSMNASSEGGKAKKSKSTNISFDGLGSPSKTQQDTVTTDELTGYRAMGNMIMNSYFKNKEHGHVFIDTELASPQRNDLASGATSQTDIRAIINSISQIGTPSQSGGKGEKAVDGQWGPRTNNALKLIFNVVAALSLIIKDFGFNIKIGEGLQKLQSLLPTNPPTENIAVLAKEITDKLLVPSISIIKKFNSQLLDNKELSDYISQRKGLAEIKSHKEPSYKKDPKQSEYYEANKLKPFTAQKIGIKSKLDNKNVELSYNSLSSIESLKKSLTEQGFESWTSPKYLPIALDQILKNIEG